MDIDLGFMAALVREGFAEAQDFGIKPEMLDGVAVQGYEWVEDYYRSYRKLPSPDVLLDQCGIDVRGAIVEPMLFWCKQIRERYLYVKMKDSLSSVVDLLSRRESSKALEEMDKFFSGLRSAAPDSNRVKSIFADSSDLERDYERSKMGVTGVPTPWPTLNLLTQGWQPEDLVVIGARMGQGKTWLLIHMAKWAWEQGNRVLFVSTEMSRMANRKRISAVVTKTSYGRLRRGNLTSMEETEFFTKVRGLEADNNFLTMGDGMSVTLESIESAVIETKPKLLCIDGVYLLRSAKIKGSKQKHERIAELFDLLKDMAKRLKVPIIVTTQLNRDKAGGGSKFGTDRLAFSDNIGMVADYVFFMKQTQTMRQAKEMEIQPGKVRESEMIKPILINWIFETQDFTEKAKSDAKGGDDQPSASKKPSIGGNWSFAKPEAAAPDNSFPDLPF